MKSLLTPVVAFLFAGFFAAQASAFEIKGQVAKDLYLALDGFVEQDIIFYSLKREASKVECLEYNQGLKYTLYQDCELIDAVFPNKALKRRDITSYFVGGPKQVEGAAQIIGLLGGAKIHLDGGNPPARLRKVSATCIAHSPIAPPAQEPAESFTCEILDL